MILIPIFVIGHKSNDFRFMDYKSKIKIINHKSMNWLSNKLFYTIGITLLCGGRTHKVWLKQKNYTMKVSTRKPNLPLKSWSNKRQAIPPIIIGMVSAATRPVI